MVFKEALAEREEKIRGTEKEKRKNIRRRRRKEEGEAGIHSGLHVRRTLAAGCCETSPVLRPVVWELRRGRRQGGQYVTSCFETRHGRLLASVLLSGCFVSFSLPLLQFLLCVWPN